MSPRSVRNAEFGIRASTEEWISAAARMRALRFSGKELTEEELEWLEEVKPIIEQMERDPAKFSEFQTELIKTTVPTLDEERIDQIKQIIADTYDKAVAQSLDLPSKPADNYQDWVQRRHELDRAGTAAVQDILSPGERQFGMCVLMAGRAMTWRSATLHICSPESAR